MPRTQNTPKGAAPKAPKSSSNGGMSRAQRRALNRGNGNGGAGGLTIQQAPVAVSQSMGSSRPNISSDSRSGDLRVRVRHREYIGEIAGSIAYAVQQYKINPGLYATFPWLAQMANLFESYKFNQLAFEYKTESATTAKGKVILSVDWDAADAPPATKQQQLQERTKLDCAAWAVARMNCDQADLWKFGIQRYIRAGVVANTDIKTYDVGNLNVGVQGMADTSLVGELYVVYDVELITPNQASGLVNPALEAKIVSGGVVSKTAPYGTAPVQTGQLAVVASNTASGTLTFAQTGKFLVCQKVTGTGIGSSPVLAFTAANVTEILSGGALLSTTGSEELLVEITAAGQTVNIDWSPETTITASETRIAPYTLN